MSDLTDKIRAKYPDDYKDMSDDDLEKSILAKHPEYKDLANSVKSPNDNASQTDNGGKPSNDVALKAPESSLKASPSEANARGESDSLSASKSLSKGNLEANRAPGQDNIINPEEHESLLSKGWKLLSEPLTHIPSDIANKVSDTINPDKETKGLKGYGSAFIEGLGHIGDEMTSPLNAGLMGLTGGESLATKLGSEDIIPTLRTGSKVLSAPIIAHGASNVLGSDKSLGDRAMGLIEMGMGSLPFLHNSIGDIDGKLSENTPVFKGSEVSNASEQDPELMKEVLKSRPDLVPVGDESKFIDNGNNSNYLNHDAPIPRDLKNAQPRFNFGQDSYTPKFDSDLDKSLFIIAQKTPSKRDADYLKYVMDATGLNEQEARNAGINIKSQVKELLRNEDPGEVDIPQLYQPKINEKPINQEDRLLNLVKDKQNMGKELPIDNIELYHKLKNDLDSRNAMGHVVDYEDELDNLNDQFGVINSMSKENSDIINEIIKANNQGHIVYPPGYRGDKPSGILIRKLSDGSSVYGENPLTPPTTSGVPQFNPRNQSGMTGNIQNKPRLLLNSDGSFINKETGEMYDMRGHKIDELDSSRPASLIDASSDMSNKEALSNHGSDNEPPDNDIPKNNEPNDPNEEKKITLSDVINFPKSMKTLWHVGAAPFRQGAGLITTKPWWTAWNDMFEGMKGEDAFKATQKAIENRPLFKSYGDQPSFAEKAGLKLTNLGSLTDREEDMMSRIADKIPGVKTTQRGYTAYMNKLRADSFEDLLTKFKTIGEDGEINMPLAKQLAEYVNDATGRSSLPNNSVTGNLEKSAVALNNAFFSPRFLMSRLKILGESAKAPFTPSTYMFSQPSVRREYLRSLLSIAGIGATLGELAKLGGGEVSHDPSSSDFGKIKVGNTRIDPYAGMQQPIVLANRLITGKSTSSVSGKTTDLDNPKYGQSNRMDVIGSFARSKESPAVAFAHGLLTGKDITGKKFDVPEQVGQLFIPMILQDLKQVATENPNLIPNYHSEGLGFENTDAGRVPLAIPGMLGMGEQNYPSKVR